MHNTIQMGYVGGLCYGVVCVRVRAVTAARRVGVYNGGDGVTVLNRHLKRARVLV